MKNGITTLGFFAARHDRVPGPDGRLGLTIGNPARALPPSSQVRFRLCDCSLPACASLLSTLYGLRISLGWYEVPRKWMLLNPREIPALVVRFCSQAPPPCLLYTVCCLRISLGTTLFRSAALDVRTFHDKHQGRANHSVAVQSARPPKPARRSRTKTIITHSFNLSICNYYTPQSKARRFAGAARGL